MTDWLLKFGFGGVQRFISHSRKVRDLAESSRLIQELADHALTAASRDHGARILLPADPSDACPHQAVLQLTGCDEETVKACGEAMREAVRSKWLDYAKASGLTAASYLAQTVTDTFVTHQLEDAFEMYWVAVPEDGENFRAAFDTVLKRFDDRRHTRTFQQAPKPPRDLKPWSCLQCGERMGVVRPEDRESLPRDSKGKLDQRDRLCAVCLAKRLGSYKNLKDVPSTHELAADRILRAKWRYPGSTLVEALERWDELGARDSGAGPNGVDQKLLDAHEWLTRGGEDDGRRIRDAITPYYAAVVFDGDEMGKWFTGVFLQSDNDIKTHIEKLSGHLSEFAKGLRELTENHRGLLVYAGGDDGFALLPADTALPYLNAVHERWEKKVADEIQGDEDRRPTLSAHVSVVHQKTPLQPVVAELHELLDRAKDKGERNSLSILADVRSGTRAQLIAGWDELPRIIEAIEWLCIWRSTDPVDNWPSQGELAARREQTMAATLPHHMVEASTGFFSDAGRCFNSSALERELHRLAGRSGGGRACTGWIAWLIDRVDRGTGPPHSLHGGLHAGVTDREVFETALTVPSFLARELDWR